MIQNLDTLNNENDDDYVDGLRDAYFSRTRIAMNGPRIVMNAFIYGNLRVIYELFMIIHVQSLKIRMV